MAVAVDNQVSAHVTSDVTLTSGLFTISGTNRVAIMFLSFAPNSITFTNASVGGVAGSIVSGSDSTTENGVVRNMMVVVVNPPTGSQSGTANWTGAAECQMGIVTFTGADQVTGANNGTRFVGGSGETSDNLAVTSVSGDRTCTALYTTGGSPTTNQTIQWTSSPWAQDTGPGTTTPTHTWTFGGSFNVVIVGANVFAVATSSTDHVPLLKRYP